LIGPPPTKNAATVSSCLVHIFYRYSGPRELVAEADPLRPLSRATVATAVKVRFHVRNKTAAGIPKVFTGVRFKAPQFPSIRL
jgi:hypothetical protein